MFFQSEYLTFPVGKPVEVRILPVFPVQINERTEYTAAVYPFSGAKLYGLRNRKNAPGAEAYADFGKNLMMKKEGESLSLSMTFPQEDCYVISLQADGKEVERMEVYALEEDLFTLTPFKGDNHMHTCNSDGMDSAAVVAAMACKRGYDYCSITDHKLYGPSIEARDFFAGTSVDFTVVPGEEVHSPDNPVHLISFGGSESVNDWWRDHEDEYRAAVSAEIKTMTGPMTEGDRYAAAASQVMFDRIRKVGGVSIFCHPNWMLSHGFNEHEDITDYLMDHVRFDALELIAGGAYTDGTQMQVSYYHDRPQMPILGSSDMHGIVGHNLEPGNYTIVLAECNTAEGLKSAIRKGHTVAGFENRLYGEYRLVKYGYFLLRTYYPEHDEKRRIVGNAMMRLANGASAADFPKNLPRPSEMFENRRYRR